MKKLSQVFVFKQRICVTFQTNKAKNKDNLYSVILKGVLKKYESQPLGHQKRQSLVFQTMKGKKENLQK